MPASETTVRSATNAAVREQQSLAALHDPSRHGRRWRPGVAAAGRGGAGGAAPAPAANRNKVGIVDLRAGTTSSFDDVQSYSLSSDGSHVALRRYGAGRRGTGRDRARPRAGTEVTFGNVAESSWNEAGSQLAMIIDVEGKTGNGVQLLDVKSGAIRSLDAEHQSVFRA